MFTPGFQGIFLAQCVGRSFLGEAVQLWLSRRQCHPRGWMKNGIKSLKSVNGFWLATCSWSSLTSLGPCQPVKTPSWTKTYWSLVCIGWVQPLTITFHICPLFMLRSTCCTIRWGRKSLQNTFTSVRSNWRSFSASSRGGPPTRKWPRTVVSKDHHKKMLHILVMTNQILFGKINQPQTTILNMFFRGFSLASGPWVSRVAAGFGSYSWGADGFLYDKRPLGSPQPKQSTSMFAAAFKWSILNVGCRLQNQNHMI